MKTILDYVDQQGIVSDDDCFYPRVPLPFTAKEFQRFTHEIFGAANLNSCRLEDETFESYAVPFEREGKNYWLFAMWGQGSWWCLYTESAWNEMEQRRIEMKMKSFDPDL